MSGAQAKAGTIAGSITVIAEVSEAALNKRHAQGYVICRVSELLVWKWALFVGLIFDNFFSYFNRWVMEKTNSLDECIRIIREYREKKEPLSLGYHGNVVDLWERLAEEAEKSEKNGKREILGTF